MDTDISKLRVGQAKPAGTRTIDLPSVSVFRTPDRNHGTGCVGCELRGLLRSISGWANLYELSKGDLSDEDVGRLVDALRRNVWEVRRILTSASLVGENSAVGPNPVGWLVETVNPVIFLGSVIMADSKSGLFLNLRDLANRAMNRLTATECTLLTEVPTHVSA